MKPYRLQFQDDGTGKKRRYVADNDDLIFQAWPTDGDIRVLAHLAVDDIDAIDAAMEALHGSNDVSVTIETTLLAMVSNAIDLLKTPDDWAYTRDIERLRRVLTEAMALVDSVTTKDEPPPSDYEP